MKTLLLLLLLPLFSYSQEKQIGICHDNVCTFDPQIILQAQHGIDSLSNEVYRIDSVKKQNDSVLTIYMHENENRTRMADRMIVKMYGDTVKTAPDFYACLNTCTVYDCVNGCLKTANCACSCDGSCVEKNLGVTLYMSFGQLIRQRILTHYGNYIPQN